MKPVITTHPMEDFKARSRGVLNDPGQRQNFRGAMDFLQAKRRAQFPDLQELDGLRELGASIRRHSLAHLPGLLEQLEARLTANGIQVHWAQTPDEANAIALDIAQRVQAKHIIKGKSMVSEEVGFNHAMEAAGIEAFESDMGEYIVQLAGETPSHIIMPAIHKTKQEIARLFEPNVVASMRMRLEDGPRVITLGIGMGLLIILLIFITNVWFAAPFLIMLGALGGFLVVPMNALLQHRGHNLMGAGRSIAVQNFNEQACILVLGALYSLSTGLGLPTFGAITLFGLVIAGFMWVIKRWHARNCREHGTEVERLLAIARNDKAHG